MVAEEGDVISSKGSTRSVTVLLRGSARLELAAPIPAAEPGLVPPGPLDDVSSEAFGGDAFHCPCSMSGIVWCLARGSP